MSEVDDALDRLERAVDALAEAVAAVGQADDEGRPSAEGPDGASGLAAERDRLAAETAELRAAAERDAALRAEAAEAVKAALADLRALVPEAVPPAPPDRSAAEEERRGHG